MASVAEVSDVSVAKKQSTLRTRSILLPSERREAPVESMAFTTTPALVEMCRAWWSEFRERDGDSVSPQVKLRTLFRSSLNKHVQRIYESPDDVLALEPPSGPPTGYPWLPTPQKRMEIDERDMRSLESSARLALRASNFAEVLLQAWDASFTDVEFHFRLKKSLSSVVKTVMQTQLAVAYGCMQLRRDHYLAGAKGLSADAVARLRHAPALDTKRLFPSDIMKDVDENNQRQIQTKAFLRFASTATSQRGRSVRGRDKADTGFRPAQHRQFAKQRQDQNRPYWYDQSAIPGPLAPAVLKKEGGGAQKFRARQVVSRCPSKVSHLSSQSRLSSPLVLSTLQVPMGIGSLLSRKNSIAFVCCKKFRSADVCSFSGELGATSGRPSVCPAGSAEGTAFRFTRAGNRKRVCCSNLFVHLR